MTNPYIDLTQLELQDQLIDCRAEQVDLVERMNAIGLEMRVNQEHLGMIHRALGASVMHGSWEVQPRFVPSHDDPFLGVELAEVVNIWR